MKITVLKENRTVVLSVEGRIDSITSPDLETETERQLTYDVKEFVLDLAQVDYISSAGLRVVLKAFQKMNAFQGKMKVIHTSSEVRKVFETVGFEKILDIS